MMYCSDDSIDSWGTKEPIRVNESQPVNMVQEKQINVSYSMQGQAMGLLTVSVAAPIPQPQHHDIYIKLINTAKLR